MNRLLMIALLFVCAAMFSCTGSSSTDSNNGAEKVVGTQLPESSEVENVKFAMDYEPVISRLEDAIAVMNAKLLTGEEITEGDKTELDDAIKEIDKYEDAKLQSDYQFRYNAVVERLGDLIINGVVNY